MATRDVHTPEAVAPSRRAGISEVQKQALISNLQLESMSQGREEMVEILVTYASYSHRTST
jgi:hypothetical protein